LSINKSTMQHKEVSDKLTIIFREFFNDKSIVLFNELTANDIDKWDSLSHMLLIAEIETQFSIKFRLKDIKKMRNVGDMVAIITSKL